VPSPSTNKTSAGTVLDGRFEILSTLGNGAMSVVVSARHLQLRQKVAIKMLRPEYATYPDVVTRFLREARAAACLRNEHVVSVTDVGMLPTGVPYLIMEHLQGMDLAAHLAAHGPLPVDQAVEYVFQVLEALAEAHRAGIVHRDIKPANLLVAQREDGSALVKVLDFGVSKLSGPEYTEHGLTVQSPLLGSPSYMSPEQIKNPSDVDARTDIWSLGVVLYELITGHLPFSGRTAPELVSAICAPQPTPIAGLISRAPIELVGVIGRCVHKNRDGRYSNVQELARALLPFARTAAAQVSVDRVLMIASAPRPVRPELEPSVPLPASVTHTIRDGGLRSTRVPRRRSHLMLAGAAVLSACGIGWAFAEFAGSARQGAMVPPSLGPGTPAGVCASSQSPFPRPADACPAPASANQDDESAATSPAGAVAAPAVAGAIQSPGARRPARPARDDAEEPAPETQPDAAEMDPLTRPYHYPPPRPLDPANPYSRR